MAADLRRHAWAGLSLLACLAAAPSARAEILGLVIGIDDYGPRSLQGAVNDAADLADAFGRAGVGRIVRLGDPDGSGAAIAPATREAVTAAWTDLVGAAKEGDTIVFAFAGHGMSVPELIPGSEPDGKDELLVLSEAAGAPPGDALLLDDELDAMFRAAFAKGVRVLSVIDACNSGTAYRLAGFDRRTRELPYDGDDLSAVRERVEASRVPGPSTGDDAVPPLLANLSAVDDDHQVAEIEIPAPDGTPVIRGALSASVAAILRTALLPDGAPADEDGDGWLSVGELGWAVEEGVGALTRQRQQPLLSFGLPDDTRLLPVLSPPPPPPVAPIVVRIIEPSRSIPEGFRLPEAVAGVPIALAGPGDFRDLTVEQDGTTFGQFATPVASVANEDALIALLEASVALRGFNALTTQHQPYIQVVAGGVVTGRTIHNGERFTVRVVGIARKHALAIGLGALGDVRLHALTPADDPDCPSCFTMRAAPPGGDAHFVVVASDRSLAALERRLCGLNGTFAALDALSIVRDALAGGDDLLGVHAVSTDVTQGLWELQGGLEPCEP